MVRVQIGGIRFLEDDPTIFSRQIGRSIMKYNQFLRANPTVAILMLVVICSVGAWGIAQQRQYMLNMQLIDAVVHDDVPRALHLLDAGADPNTNYMPPGYKPPKRGFWQRLWDQLHGYNYRPTALQIACGEEWGRFDIYQYRSEEDPRLVEAMLQHGGNTDLRFYRNRTLMMIANQQCRERTVEVLLRHGVDANARDIGGWTELMHAASQSSYTNSVHQLIVHGAKINGQSNDGESALYCKLKYATYFGPVTSKTLTDGAREIVSELMACGANPELPTKDGDTAIKLALRKNRPDLVALMQQRRKETSERHL